MKRKIIAILVLFIVVVGGSSLKMKQPSYQYATLTIYGKQEKPIQYSIHNQDKIDLLVKTLNQSIHFKNAQKDYEKTKGPTYQIELDDQQVYIINGNDIIKDQNAYLLENKIDIFDIFDE